MRNIIAILFMSIVLCGCGKGEEVPQSSVFGVTETKVTTQTVSADVSKIITVGNHSYAPVDLNEERPSNKVDEILNLLAEFEKKHPELEVTHWHIEKQQSAHTTGQKIFGIWIDHRPKKE